MGPTVLLRHELPGGSWHYDWLIARSEHPGGPGDRVLLAFRLERRPDEAGQEGGEMAATRMPDHRVAYLSYEGPISGGRGAVSRVGEGWARLLAEEEGRIDLEVDLGRGARVLRGRRVEGDRWVFAPEG